MQQQKLIDYTKAYTVKEEKGRRRKHKKTRGKLYCRKKFRRNRTNRKKDKS